MRLEVGERGLCVLVDSLSYSPSWRRRRQGAPIPMCLLTQGRQDSTELITPSTTTVAARAISTPMPAGAAPRRRVASRSTHPEAVRLMCERQPMRVFEAGGGCGRCRALHRATLRQGSLEAHFAGDKAVSRKVFR